MKTVFVALFAAVLAVMLASCGGQPAMSTGAASATDSVKGQVILGGAPIARSTVTLWEASADAPKQIDQAKSSDDGRFELSTKGARADSVLYLVATGGVPKA